MAEVPSTLSLPIGGPAPHFTLPNPDGLPTSIDSLRGLNGLIIAFVSNHCPYVIHLAPSFGLFAAECANHGISTVAIGSNDIETYPDDGPTHMPRFATTHSWNFPYLYDKTQAVARAYLAACTPDFYLFDKHLNLFYAGQFDDSRPRNNKPITGNSLRHAVTALLAGDPPPSPQTPATGCNIKWKIGTEPAWFSPR